MKSYKAFPFLILVACVFLGSCSGLPQGSSGGGGSTANVSFVLVSDTPPATLGLISFKVVPSAITLTPATGTTTTLSINGGNGYSYDLVRMQSDSGFLGTAPAVVTGTYTSIAVTFSSATLAFYNGTGVTISNLNPPCLNNSVCIASFSGPFISTITNSQAINGNAGFAIDVNLANSLVLTGGNLSLSFDNSGAFPVTSAFAIPRTNSNLAAGQLALIEDITGVVSNATNTGVTITPSAQLMNSQFITALANSSSGTNFDPDPTNTLCPSGTTALSSCVSNSQAASMDAILNADGTFTIREIEPLLNNPIVDTVEGTVYSIASSTNAGNLTQFNMIVTNLIPAATNSLIGSLSIASKFTVNIANNPTPFFVDTKGLQVQNGFPNNYNLFAGGTNTGVIHLGQTVAVRVTAFTAANGNTPASSTVSGVILRWTRFTANAFTPNPGLFTISALPGHFGFNQGVTFGVQTFTNGSQGTDGITNLEGFPSDTSSLTQGRPVAIRALFLEDPTLSQNPAFFAAKVRQQQ